MVFDFSFFFLLLVYLLSIIICIVFSCCLSLSSKKKYILTHKKKFSLPVGEHSFAIQFLFSCYARVLFFFYNQLTKRQGRQPQIHTIIGTIHTTNKPECENEREREREKLTTKKIETERDSQKKNTKKKNLFPLEFSFLIFIFIESFPIDFFFNSFWDLFYSTNLIIYKSCQNQLVLQIYQIKGMYLRKKRSRGFKQGTDQKQHDQKEKKKQILKNKTKNFFAVSSVCLFVCWLV